MQKKLVASLILIMMAMQVIGSTLITSIAVVNNNNKTLNNVTERVENVNFDSKKIVNNFNISSKTNVESQYITEDDLVYSKKYLVKDNIISKIDINTTKEEFIKNIEIAKDEEIEIYKKDGETKLENKELIGTGMLLKGSNGEEYKLSVRGDITGDGQANQIELTMMIRHLIELKDWKLEDINEISGDITGDKKIDLLDIDKIIKYIVFGTWEYENVEAPNPPIIEVIGEKTESTKELENINKNEETEGTDTETIDKRQEGIDLEEAQQTDIYKNKVEIRIRPENKEKTSKTTYKITGKIEKEETSIEENEKIILTEEGEYVVTAYSYGLQGNRSKASNVKIVIKQQDKPVDPDPVEPEPKIYNIEYVLNGGENSKENPDTYKQGTEVVLKQASKIGHTFEGWYKEAEFKNKIEKIEKTQAGNIILYAKWTANKYTINYELNGGTLPEDTEKEYTYGEKKELKDPIKEGNEFEGWYRDPELTEKIDEIDEEEIGEITIYAKWEVVDYKINYNLNGGELELQNPTTYTIETENITLNNPTKVGYTFIGWTLQNDKKPEENTQVPQLNVTIPKGSVGNRVYTANYIANTDTKYKVIHEQMNLDGETYTAVETQELRGTTDSKVTPEVKQYVGFTSPEAQEVTIAGDGSTIVTYKYIRNKYEYTLGTSEGITTEGSTPSGNYYYGEEINLNAVINSGYIWNKWVSNNEELVPSTTEKNITFTMPAGNIEMMATTTLSEYTITYELNGGENSKENPNKYVYGKEIELKEASKRGHSFEGWYKDSEFKNKIEKIESTQAGNIIVYAKFSANKYTINYELNGGTLPEEAENEYTYGEEQELKDPVKEGNEFEGWYRDPELTDKIEKIEEDEIGEITIYAKWEVIDYIISYNLNDGEIETQNPTTYTIETESFTLNNPSKVGYTFTGWTGSNGEEPQINVIIPKGSIGNKTFTANYTANTDTKYKVIHEQMNLDGETYTAVETQELRGTTDSKVTPEVKQYVGFTSPEAQEVTIAGDGSTIVTYKYIRNKYEYTLGTSEGITTDGSTPSGSYYYGEEINLNAVVNPGYIWDKWESNNEELVPSTTETNLTFTMPAGDITLTANLTILTFTITGEAGEGGQISDVNEVVNYGENSKKDIIITPNEGKVVESIKVNDVEITNYEEDEQTKIVTLDVFENVTENKHIVVTFKDFEIEPDSPDEADKTKYPKYIPIYTVEDFRKIASEEEWEIKGRIYKMASEAIYVIQNDIDFKDQAPLTPIPIFKGILYGGDDKYTLKNIKVVNQGEEATKTDGWTYSYNGKDTYVEAPTGIFSRVIGGTTLTEYDNYIGGKIHNITFLNTEVIIGNASVGLLMGDGANVSVKDITIKSDNGSKTNLVSYCKTGSVSGGNTYGYGNVAAIAGFLFDDGNTSTFKNIEVSDIKMNLTSKNDYHNNTAGIVATSQGKAKFESCMVNNVEDAYSGIVEYANNSMSFYNCWITNSTLGNSAVTGTINSGGLIGTLELPSKVDMLKIEREGLEEYNVYNCGVKNTAIVSDSMAGGLFAYVNAYNTSLTIGKTLIDGSTIYSKAGSANSAGLVAYSNAKDVNIKNTIVKNSEIIAKGNYAPTSGGLIAQTSGNTLVENTIVKDININGANMAGAIALQTSGSGKIQISNSNFENIKFNLKLNQYGSADVIPKLENYSISSSDRTYYIASANSSCNVGGLIAYSYGDITLQDTNVKNMDLENLTLQSGGVIGLAVGSNLTISNVEASDINMKNISAPNSYQIAGVLAYTRANTTINGLKVRNVDLSNSTCKAIGGVIGIAGSAISMENLDVQDINMTNVVIKEYRASGLITHADNLKKLSGRISDITIDAKWGNTFSNTYYTGGLIGYTNSYNGLIIGENTEISNISIKQNDAKYVAGLIYQINGKLTIENGTKIDNIKVESDNNSAIGLIAYCKSGVDIEGSTISNINVKSRGYSAVGMFQDAGEVNISNSEISNVIVDNSEIPYSTYADSYNTAGMIARSSNANLTNVTIDTIEISTMNNVNNTNSKGVGGILDVGNANIIDSDINNISIQVSKNTTPNTYWTGGIVGNGKIVLSNTDVTSIVVDGYGYVGGIIGINAIQGGQIDNVNLTTCNVINGGAKYSNYSGIQIPMTGGIAGVGMEIAYSNIEISGLTLTGGKYVGGITGMANKPIEDVTITNAKIQANTSVVPSYNTSTAMITPTIVNGGVVGISINTIENASVTDSEILNGTFVGGIVGTNNSDNTNLSVKNVKIKTTDDSVIYAVGGIIGHGSNDGRNTTTIDTAVVENIEIANNNLFAGGVAGVAVPTISHAHVFGNSIVMSNSYAGGIIAGGGLLTSPSQKALNITDINVENTTISGIVSGKVYAGGTYYLSSYTGEKLEDAVENSKNEPTILKADLSISLNTNNWTGESLTSTIEETTEDLSNYKIEYALVNEISQIGTAVWNTYENTSFEIANNCIVVVRLTNVENGNTKYITKQISNIDKQNPGASLSINISSTDTNNSISANISQYDSLSGIDIQNCKWECNTTDERLGLDPTSYSNTFSSKEETINIEGNKDEKYYIHVLSVDNVGNKNETISDVIKTTLEIGDEISYSPTGTYNWQAKYCSSTKRDETDDVELDSSSYRYNVDEWKILNIENGKVELVPSSVPYGTVYLGQAQGYNNGVKLLHEACSALYGDSSKGITARSINIEDIEDLIKKATGFDATTSSNSYGNKASSAYTSANSNYPRMYATEMTKTLADRFGLSSQDSFLERAKTSGEAIDTIASTGLQPVYTYYSMNYSTLKEKLGVYADIILPSGSRTDYWIASRDVINYISSTSPYSGFEMRQISDGGLASSTLYCSNSRGYAASNEMFPIVTMDLSLISGNSISGFEVK